MDARSLCRSPLAHSILEVGRASASRLNRVDGVDDVSCHTILAADAEIFVAGRGMELRANQAAPARTC